jgi:hypothetical protein
MKQSSVAAPVAAFWIATPPSGAARWRVTVIESQYDKEMQCSKFVFQ